MKNDKKYKITKKRNFIGGSMLQPWVIGPVPEQDEAQVFDGANRNYIATLGTTGSEGASNTQFSNPLGVAVSAFNNRIYVADYSNHRVQVFDGATRNYIATLGMTGSEGASNTQFNSPRGLAVSAVDNRIYVADQYNHRVQVFDGTTLNYIATFGTTGSEGASNTQFNGPDSVAVSAVDNRIYVTDHSNQRVQVFDGTTRNYIATLGTTGSEGASNTQFNGPSGVAVSAVDNRIYVADDRNHRVQVFDGTTLNYIATLGTTGSKGSSKTQFKYPSSVAVSSADNRIYVVDNGNQRVQVFDGTTRNYIATLGTTGSRGDSNTQFNNPLDVFVSAVDNRIYVADTGNHRIQVFGNAIRKSPIDERITEEKFTPDNYKFFKTFVKKIYGNNNPINIVKQGQYVNRHKLELVLSNKAECFINLYMLLITDITANTDITIFTVKQGKREQEIVADAGGPTLETANVIGEYIKERCMMELETNDENILNTYTFDIDKINKMNQLRVLKQSELIELNELQLKEMNELKEIIEIKENRNDEKTKISDVFFECMFRILINYIYFNSHSPKFNFVFSTFSIIIIFYNFSVEKLLIKKLSDYLKMFLGYYESKTLETLETLEIEDVTINNELQKLIILFYAINCNDFTEDIVGFIEADYFIEKQASKKNNYDYIDAEDPIIQLLKLIMANIYNYKKRNDILMEIARERSIINKINNIKKSLKDIIKDIEELEKIGDIFTKIFTEINIESSINPFPNYVDIGDLSSLINIPKIINTDTLISSLLFKNNDTPIDINTLKNTQGLSNELIQVKETIDIIIDIIKHATQEELKYFLKKTTGISDTKKSITINIEKDVALKEIPDEIVRKNNNGNIMKNDKGNPLINKVVYKSTSCAYIHQCFSIIDILRFNLANNIFFAPFTNKYDSKGNPIQLTDEEKKNIYKRELKLDLFGKSELLAFGGSKQRTNKQRNTKRKNTKQRNTKRKNTKRKKT